MQAGGGGGGGPHIGGGWGGPQAAAAGEGRDPISISLRWRNNTDARQGTLP
jgi:hypothetical protein